MLKPSGFRGAFAYVRMSEMMTLQKDRFVKLGRDIPGVLPRIVL